MAAPGKSILGKFKRSLLYLAVVFVICVSGYRYYGWNLVDSVYMVVITMFGVGYGEVHPLGPAGKVFTMFVIVAGTSAVVFVIGEIIRFITEGEIMKAIGELKKSKQVEDIADHAIICGYGRIGQILAHELKAARFPFVIVDLDDTRLALADDSGYLFVKGSATDEETLQRARVERAVVLATVLPQDTLNVFITLTARNLNRHLRIIARGEQRLELTDRTLATDLLLLDGCVAELRRISPRAQNLQGKIAAHVDDQIAGTVGLKIDIAGGETRAQLKRAGAAIEVDVEVAIALKIIDRIDAASSLA